MPFFVFGQDSDENLPCAEAKWCRSGLRFWCSSPGFSLNPRAKWSSLIPDVLVCKKVLKKTDHHRMRLVYNLLACIRIKGKKTKGQTTLRENQSRNKRRDQRY